MTSTIDPVCSWCGTPLSAQSVRAPWNRGSKLKTWSYGMLVGASGESVYRVGSRMESVKQRVR